ncbi:hypothetical protein HMPREF1860_01006 [Prevotella amnii]|uniref:Uncharacterized protein n=1 Tax=Prevotella amnii TaxID=419005 RepID=A0A134BEB7_9BACT|nr:hypothetical protein HMPREF1860_01006 [Prevotella amnii]
MLYIIKVYLLFIPIYNIILWLDNKENKAAINGCLVFFQSYLYLIC